ncbi:MAG: hypothetical protein KDB82_12650 [Planctomycetes bacterium]|nr:hypothetical protein [Planctomycetota bacterium]
MPLVASLVVIALAWTGLAVWKFSASGGSKGGCNVAVPGGNETDGPASNSESDGFEYETVPLDDLPALDPLGLWPNDGMRISSPDVWVMWQTTGYSRCRLLGRTGPQNWVDLGNTSGHDHYLPLDLAYFGSEATFAVEFETNGKRYRSKPRTIHFAQGSHFASRSWQFKPSDEPNQTWAIALAGDTHMLTDESFRTTFFPDALVTFCAPPETSEDGGRVRFGITDPAGIGGAGCVGFLQLYDTRTDAYDRTLIQLTR